MAFDETKFTDLLDRALHELDADTKTRVLNLVRLLDVEGNEEFWLIFISLGYLQVLMEDMPDSLDHFMDSLEEWADSNLGILNSLEKKTQELDTLGKLLSNFMQSNIELTGILKTYQETLSSLTSSQGSSGGRSETSNPSSVPKSETIEKYFQNIDGRLGEIEQKFSRFAALRQWSFNLVLLLLGGLVAWLGTAMYYDLPIPGKNQTPVFSDQENL